MDGSPSLQAMHAPLSTAPGVHDGEYRRLLGLPPEHQVDQQIAELMTWARGWYAANGRPWVQSRRVETLCGAGPHVVVDGRVLVSHELADRCRRSRAHGAVVAAVSAGPEAEDEAARLWEAGRPAEYYFLEMYASAVVESLITSLGARLCAVSEPTGDGVLPHYSPGYGSRDLCDQRVLLQLVAPDSGEALPGKLEVLESGMTRPKKSQLALFALARKEYVAPPLAGVAACTGCCIPGCRYRRAPYRQWRYHPEAPELGLTSSNKETGT